MGDQVKVRPNILPLDLMTWRTSVTNTVRDREARWERAG